jgi:hypothetical protein
VSKKRIEQVTVGYKNKTWDVEEVVMLQGGGESEATFNSRTLRAVEDRIRVRGEEEKVAWIAVTKLSGEEKREDKEAESDGAEKNGG